MNDSHDFPIASETHSISFACDRPGRQKEITDAAGTRTFTYSNALQPESEIITGIYSETLTRTYEDGTGVKGRNSGFVLGNPDSPEYAVIYGYGTKGRFGSMTWNAGTGNGIVNYSYVPNSDLLSGYSSDTGIKTVYEYEPHRSLKTSVTNSFGPAGSETVISQYGYLYDSIGRRTSVKNSGTAFAHAAFSRYGYNDRSELTSSERYSGTEITDISSPVTPENRAYEYDPIGNRKESVAGTQQVLIYETNVLNQYTEISQGAAPVTAPEYDDDGNILKYRDKACQWNAENRLVSVHPQNPASGDKKITFLYDYMGRRVRKQVFAYSGTDWNPAPESEKLFVYDGWNMVKESTVTGGAPSVKYCVWGLDLSQSVQGAGGIGGLLCSAENGAVLYYFYDANGNTGQIVNAADGTVAAHYEYDPFGNTVTSYGDYADGNPFRFSTRYFDGETGLYYYGFRYYSAELGRWWSRDPVGENGGENLYGFCNNNGINRNDYLGKNSFPPPSMPKYFFLADLKRIWDSLGSRVLWALNKTDDFLARQNANGSAYELAVALPAPFPTILTGYNIMFFPESCEIGSYEYFSGALGAFNGKISETDLPGFAEDPIHFIKGLSSGNFVGSSVTLASAIPVNSGNHDAKSWLGWFWNIEFGFGPYAGSLYGGLPSDGSRKDVWDAIVNGKNNLWYGSAIGIGASINLPPTLSVSGAGLATYYKYLSGTYKNSVIKLETDSCLCKMIRVINYLNPPSIFILVNHVATLQYGLNMLQ